MIVSAFDPDDGQGGVIKYSIKDGDEGKFAIDKQTGTIRLAERLDFETKQKYNLTIQARDKVRILSFVCLFPKIDSANNATAVFWSVKAFLLDLLYLFVVPYLSFCI